MSLTTLAHYMSVFLFVFTMRMPHLQHYNVPKHCCPGLSPATVLKHLTKTVVSMITSEQGSDSAPPTSGGRFMQTYSKVYIVCKVCSWRTFFRLFSMKCKLYAHFLHTFLPLCTLYKIDNPILCTLIADFSFILIPAVQTLCRPRAYIAQSKCVSFKCSSATGGGPYALYSGAKEQRARIRLFIQG